MELTNEFAIAAPIDDVWKALNDPEFVAPCFPGADLTEYSGDSFSGTVRVKLGPVSLKYRGTGTYTTRNDTARTVVIDAAGRDSNGNGAASAVVTGTMREDGPGQTRVTMLTDLSITGRPAQFGRGVMSEVADKIIGQFSANLAARLNGAPGDGADAPSPQSTSVDSMDILGAALKPVARRLGIVAVVVSCAVAVACAARTHPRKTPQ
jgi:carbon monoxide dehydrogenase subunit G